MCVLYIWFVEICELMEFLMLIVGCFEKFVDKYVIILINVYVFVWKEFIVFDKFRKIRYENYLFFY